MVKEAYACGSDFGFVKHSLYCSHVGYEVFAAMVSIYRDIFVRPLHFLYRDFIVDTHSPVIYNILA